MAEYNENRTPIGDLGKFGLISRLTGNAPVKNKSTISAAGDDAAVIDTGEGFTLVSTDMLLEGIHFNLVYSPLKHLGYKAVVRAISDIYAMNGIPSQVLIAIGISSRFSVEQIDELYEGIYLACKRYDTDLAGGDTTTSLTGLIIGMTAVGNVNRERLVRRSGAKPNDLICVTGDFGASYMGLQLLERERRLFEKEKVTQPDLSGYEYIIGRQLKPEFPVAILRSLNKNGILPSSMIDVSDGLATDILNICRLSDTGCRIFIDRIPIDPETARLAEEFRLDPVIPALNGGEDYELLFTVPLAMNQSISQIPGIKIIGHMTTFGQGRYLVSENGTEIELNAQGWEKQSS
jgi:thiamine-monophosphate kinase